MRRRAGRLAHQMFAAPDEGGFGGWIVYQVFA
jgi:hypothetical protein